MTESPQLLSEAHVATAHARRYLRMLCKHFRPKSPTIYDEVQGRIEFPTGTCALDAGAADVLNLRLATNYLAALASLEDVVARHLKAFCVARAARSSLDKVNVTDLFELGTL